MCSSGRTPPRCASADGEITGIVIMAREATRRGGQRASDRIGLLERIGERLASSLELDVTLRQVAETLVPQFADHCFIDLLHGDDLVRRAQLHSRGWMPEPGTWALVGEQISVPGGPLLRSRRWPGWTRSSSRTSAEEDFPRTGGASLQTCDDMRLTSVIAAPLIARGQLLGVMSLALSRLTEREERHYGADDRDFLCAIASRVAIAIDNSMLFEEERRTALAFQTSLLPKDPPFVDGLEVAYKYVPAKPLETHGQGIQTQVGGDWYDIIPLSAGRVGIVIGDVEGRGARAAAVMGQLRAALRAFAQDDKSPAEILRQARRLGAGRSGRAAAEAHGFAEADPPTVSCTYLVYDAWSRTLSFANAGPHAAADRARPRREPAGDPATRACCSACAARACPACRPTARRCATWRPAPTLIFYTDGLVDRRQRADGNGHYTDAEVMQMLRAAVRTAADGSVEQIAEAAEQAVPGEIDDDMAVVVVRTSAVDLASWEGQFPAEPIRVSEARRLAHETFVSWGMDIEQADLTCLLVSEVVTNVVLHAAVSPTPRHELVLEGAGPGPLGHPRRLGDPAVRRGLPRPAGQGIHPPAAPRSRGHLGRGLRLRPAAAAGSAAPGRATKAAAACTWSTSSRPGGARGRPRTARRSGSRCRSRPVPARAALL